MERSSSFQFSDTMTDADTAGFYRLQTVNPLPGFKPFDYKILRSSSPNYNPKDNPKNPDATQHFNSHSIPYLQQERIGHIICLNGDDGSCKTIKQQLDAASPVIQFTRLSVQDFHAPILGQLKEGYRRYVEVKKPTLVWCGYGQGRTGTMITALEWQIEKARGTNPKISHQQYKDNGVEQYASNGQSTGQVEVLDDLQAGKTSFEAEEVSQEATVSTVDD